MSIFTPGDIQTIADWGRCIAQARYKIVSLPWAKQLPVLRSAYSSELLLDYLKQTYREDRIFRVGERCFPTVVLRCQEQPDEPDSVLGELDPQWNNQLAKFLRGPYWLMRSVAKSYEHRTFTFRQCTTPPASFALDCGIVGFFTALRDSISLEWELLDAVSKSVKSGTPVTDRLPLRNSLHEQVGDPLVSGKGRASAVGISALIAYQDDEALWIVLRRRGQLSISTRYGMFHAFPAGFFQAPFGVTDVEYSVAHGTLWEYYEEFYDVSDPIRANREPTWFYKKSPVQDLRSLLENGKASHTLLGVAVDLMNLRPEILTLLHVKDPNWFARNSPQFRFNREMATSEELGFGQNVLCRVDCSLQPEQVFSENELDAGTIAPCSAAALALALRHLGRTNNDNVSR